MRQRGRRAARPITAQAPVAIALAIAYAWVTTGFSLSMSLLACLMACCAEVMAADAPDGAGSPDALSEERPSLKRSDVPARNRDGISGLAEVVQEAAVNVVLDGAGHVVVNRPADAVTVAAGAW